MEIREKDPDLKAIREWLSKWGNLYISNKLKKREKAISELYKFAEFLKMKQTGINLTSILRGKATINPDGTFGYEPDFESLGQEFSRLIAKMSRSQIFLSCLHRSFSFEDSIGADIAKMRNRPLIK